MIKKNDEIREIIYFYVQLWEMIQLRWRINSIALFIVYIVSFNFFTIYALRKRNSHTFLKIQKKDLWKTRVWNLFFLLFCYVPTFVLCVWETQIISFWDFSILTVFLFESFFSSFLLTKKVDFCWILKFFYLAWIFK